MAGLSCQLVEVRGRRLFATTRYVDLPTQRIRQVIRPVARLGMFARPHSAVHRLLESHYHSERQHATRLISPFQRRQ